MERNEELKTSSDELGLASRALQVFADSESMDVSNDPRFFQDNVIDKRLAAFASLSVVSDILVGACMDDVMGMNKNFDFATTDGYVQAAGFCTLSLVLMIMVLSAYVGVAQTYHTVRLMTGGATGFEMAAAYYLNKNIVFYRHFAIKMMLLGLPILLFSTGLRLLHKFNVDQQDSGAMWVAFKGDQSAPGSASATDAGAPITILGLTIPGLVTAAFYVVSSLLLFCVHLKHQGVFREMYEVVGQNVPLLHGGSGTLTARNRKRPDV